MQKSFCLPASANHYDSAYAGLEILPQNHVSGLWNRYPQFLSSHLPSQYSSSVQWHQEKQFEVEDTCSDSKPRDYHIKWLLNCRYKLTALFKLNSSFMFHENPYQWKVPSHFPATTFFLPSNMTSMLDLKRLEAWNTTDAGVSFWNPIKAPPIVNLWSLRIKMVNCPENSTWSKIFTQHLRIWWSSL